MGNSTDSGVAVNEKMGFIYGLVCLCGDCDPNRVMYVGQTTREPEYRRRAHRDAARRPTHTDYSNVKSQWIRDHSSETLGVVTLATGPVGSLDDLEVRLIHDLDTLYPNGVNTRLGGHQGAGSPGESNPGAKLTEEQVKEIIELIGTDMTVTSRSLGRAYNVTKTLILKIDSGFLWPELERPYGLRVLGSRNTKARKPESVHQDVRDCLNSGMTKAQTARKLDLSFGFVSRVEKETD